MAITQLPNQRCSLDFMSDALTDSRKFRVLCVIDDVSRECLATFAGNQSRPHTSLDGLTPTAFANRSNMDHN
jgi:transposase InsO family protein